MHLRDAMKLLLCSMITLSTNDVMGQASLTSISETNSGAWKYGLMENNRSGRQFCFAETNSKDGTTIRVVAYKDSDWFIEIFNKRWNLRKTNTHVSFSFNGGRGLELRMNADGIALTHDLLDHDKTLVIFSQIATSQKFSLTNSNRGALGDFSASGSDAALRYVLACEKA